MLIWILLSYYSYSWPVSVSQRRAHSRAVVFHTLHRGLRDTRFYPYLVTCTILDPSVVPAKLFFPTWREWWFDDIVLQFSVYHNIILITEPQPIFMDRTKDLETWNVWIKYQKLISIADICDQFLLPNVICPWGFSEFINKVGYVNLDTVILLFLFLTGIRVPKACA